MRPIVGAAERPVTSKPAERNNPSASILRAIGHATLQVSAALSSRLLSAIPIGTPWLLITPNRTTAGKSKARPSANNLAITAYSDASPDHHESLKSTCVAFH